MRWAGVNSLGVRETPGGPGGLRGMGHVSGNGDRWMWGHGDSWNLNGDT